MTDIDKSSAIVAGVDIGSMTCEAVIFNGSVLLGHSIESTGSFPRKAAEKALLLATNQAQITSDRIRSVVCTGYGRNLLTGAKAVTEITCFAAGAYFFWPQVEMVIDIGGQDSKVILVKRGQADAFLTNDKCAAGTGRFLETMARALGMQVDEMASIGIHAEPSTISSTCGVFAESEIIGLLAAETPLEKIIAGINKSIVDRTLALVHRAGIRNKIMFCGGVSKNEGVRTTLEKALGFSVKVPPEPQIVGALGAAVIAGETL